jgi:hypothetical protein
MFDHTAWLDRTSRTQPHPLVDVGAFADDRIILDGDSPTPPRAVYAFAHHVVCHGASRDDRDISPNAGLLTDDYGTYIDDCTVPTNLGQGPWLTPLSIASMATTSRSVRMSKLVGSNRT